MAVPPSNSQRKWRRRGLGQQGCSSRWP
jgi:hypothetical protein